MGCAQKPILSAKPKAVPEKGAAPSGAAAVRAEKRRRQRQRELRLQKRALQNKDHRPTPQFDDNERTLVMSPA
jgi:hypothetical protein